jgi:hypothetical protein
MVVTYNLHGPFSHHFQNRRSRYLQDVKMEVSKQSDFLDRLAKMAIILDDHRLGENGHPRMAMIFDARGVRLLGHIYIIIYIIYSI